jgi:alcohol-forming fatty acyl-CoA reductase
LDDVPEIPKSPESPGPTTASGTPEPAAPKRAVYADVDGTLCATNLLGALQYLKRHELGGPLFAFWRLGLLVKIPYWAVLDCFSRARANESICFEYCGMDVEDVRDCAESCYRAYIRPRFFPQALKRVKDMHAMDYRIVLMTGSIDFLMKPLARDLRAELIAPSLAEVDGLFTGALETGSLVGERKANALYAHAEDNNIDLEASFALADSYTDVPMLECVGHPVAVNPDRKLARIARERNWPVEHWKRK